MGTVAKMASPQVAQQIGSYFKENAQDGSAAHLVAHAVLGAAVAAATGTDAVTAGVSAATAEGAAPKVANWLYGTSDPDKLSAEQKGTISAIVGLAGAAAGATTASNAGIVASGSAAQMAVEDNRFLSQSEQQKAMAWARQSNGRFTQAQIMDALRWSNNLKTGATWSKNIISSTPYDNMIGGKTSVTAEGMTGAQGNNGILFVQSIQNIPRPDQEIIDYIMSKSNGTYIWDQTSWPQIGAQGMAPSQKQEAYSYKPSYADGKTYMLPYANCPAAGCKATSVIAWYSSNPADQAVLSKYKDALTRETAKGVATIAVSAPALMLAPEAFFISSGVNAGAQVLKSGNIDPYETLLSGAGGAAGAGLTAVPAISKAMSLGTAPRVVISAGVGAVTGLAGDSATKLINDQKLTVEGAGTSAAAGFLGGVPKNPIIQSGVTEFLNWRFNK